MLNHIDLKLYYKTVFSLIQHHKYSLTEIESMMPYEFEIYIDLLSEFLNEQSNNQHK